MPAAIASLAACHAFNVPLASCPTLRLPQVPAATKVVVRYLGVGGFLIRRGEDVVLTAPLYSNPSLIELLGDHSIRPDTGLIDRLLPPEASEAKAILVGHSHYDHLLDVPYVALHRATRADVFGSTTTLRLLAPIAAELSAKPVATKVVALDEVAGDHERPGQWIHPGGAMRFMALRSEHAPQFTIDLFSQKMPVHLWRGAQDQPVSSLPAHPSEWPEGPVFAFVIDFLDPRGTPEFRIYYQDSGTNAPVGFVPDAVTSERRVDLAIVCAGGDFTRLRSHPEGILRNTRPRHVLLAHWEDFFVTQDAYVPDGRIYEIPPAIQGKTARFRKRVRRALEDDAVDWLPCPTTSVFEFPVAPEAAPDRRATPRS